LTSLPLVPDGDDELGENLFNAPLPPYDRPWLHPSEHAQRATESPSTRFEPSTVRQLAVFTALTSVALSAAMVVVALPGAPDAPSPARTMESGLVGATPPKIAVYADPIAAAMTQSGLLLSVIDGAQIGQTVHVRTPGSSEYDAKVVDVDEDLGVSVLKVVETSTASSTRSVDLTPIAPARVTPGEPVWVATANFGVEMSHISTSTSTSERSRIPLEPFSASHHGGAVFDTAGSLLGWCVERDGAHWLVPASALRSSVLRLDDDVEQP